MAIDKKKLEDAINKMLEDKGKRKFIQSAEVIVNFRGVDFSKPENRLNIDVVLPHGKGHKTPKVAVIGDENITNMAKKAGAELVILPEELPKYKEDKGKLQDLASNYILLAQPNQMGQVARHLGQYLGPRGKLPRPIVGPVEKMIERARKLIRITTKGKYLPTVQAFVGTEEMEPEKIRENVEAVIEGIKKKVPEHNIKSVYVKLTMGKPIRVI